MDIQRSQKKPLNFLGDTLSFNSIAKLSLDPYLYGLGQI